MKSNQTDILLIHPGNRKQVYQALGSELSAVEPPVWAGLMTTYLRNKGFEVQLIDADAEELSPEATAQRVAALRPLLTAVIVYGHQPSASTQTMPAAGVVCRAIKQADPAQKVILVGGHVAALSERALREESVDFVAGGEGPVTLWELMQALKANGSGDLSKVRGLWYREGGEIRANEPAPLVKDPEQEMPGMPWDMLPMEKYRAHNWHCFGDLERQPYASIYTTLGCPFHCSFCCIQAPFKSGEKLLGYKQSTNSYRFWSPKRVADELEFLVKQYGVRNVKIADEMFVLNLNHVGGICDAIIERGLKLNIWAYARVDTVKDQILDKLKRAGVNWLAFGIESANERVRGDVQKGFGQAEIFKTIGKVRETGINVIGNYIFGLPEDDLQTMQETLDLAIELNCEFSNFYSAMAYPGSPLYEQALREGWPLPESWGGYSQHSVDSLPLPTKYLSAGEVLAFRDQAFHTYFESSRYLEMVRTKFGPETEAHTRQMVSVRLVRKHVPGAQQRQQEVVG